MRIAHGDPYKEIEMRGEAEPTMTRPNTHRMAMSTAMAWAVPTPASRWRTPRPAGADGRRRGGVSWVARRGDVALGAPAGRAPRVTAAGPTVEIWRGGWRPRVRVRAFVTRSVTRSSSSRQWEATAAPNRSTCPPSLAHPPAQVVEPGPARSTRCAVSRHQTLPTDHQTLPTERKSP